MTVSFSDNFNRADGPVGSNYTGIFGKSVLQVVSNAVSTTSTTDSQVCRWNVNSFAADQFAQWTYTTASTGYCIAVLYLRLGGTDASPNGYAADFWTTDSGPLCRLIRYDSGTENILTTTSSTSFSTGDVFRVKMVGSNLTVYSNNTSILTYSDSTYTSGGYVGIGMYAPSVSGGLRYDNLTGGDLNQDITSATTDSTDTVSISGTVTSSATVAKTDGADTSSATSTVTSSATTTTTDGTDTSAATLTVTSSATTATTDGADTSSASANVVSNPTATVAVTDGTDTSAATLTVTSSATVSKTDGADIFANNVTVTSSATTTTTDGADTSNAVVSVTAPGMATATVAKTDGADVSSAVVAIYNPVYATSGTTDGADTSQISAFGLDVWTDITTTQAPNWSVIVTQFSAPPVGQVNVTDGTDIFSITTTYSGIFGTVSVADGTDSFTSYSSVDNTNPASSNTTDGADTFAATATIAVSATVAKTDGTDTLFASLIVNNNIAVISATTDGADVLLAPATVSMSQPTATLRFPWSQAQWNQVLQFPTGSFAFVIYDADNHNYDTPPPTGAYGTANPLTAANIPAAHAAGIKVIGHINGAGTQRTLAEIKHTIDGWYAAYGTALDGIFVGSAGYFGGTIPDGMGTYVNYWANIADYIRAKGGAGFCVIHPSDDTYAGNAVTATDRQNLLNKWDSIMIYERYITYVNGVVQLPTLESWYTNYDRSRFIAYIDGCNYADLPTVESYFINQNVGRLMILRAQDDTSAYQNVTIDPTYLATFLSGLSTTAGYSYPRNGAYAISGGAGFDQTYPSAADQERIGKLNIAILGGNTAGNFYPNPGGQTRQQIYQSMKNYSATYGTGLKLYQYVNYNEGPIGSPSDGWNVAVNNPSNNWWLYQSGTSGLKSRSGFDPNFNLINMTHFSPQASGKYPYQYGAYWTYQYLIANSGPDQATALDGFFVDNLFPYSANHSPDPTDYSRVGNPSLVTDTDFQNGQADFMNYGRGTVDATRGWGGNWFYSPYGYQAPPFNNNLDIALMESTLGWDQVLNAPSLEWYESTASYLYIYTQACSNTFKTTNPYMVVNCVGLDSTGNIPNYTALNVTPYQGTRYNMAIVAMGDGFFYDDGSSLHTAGPNDCRDWDERVGGTMNTQGWLGAALEGQQTNVRIGASVYYRDFQYGRVYLNAKGASTVTIDLTGFRRLSSRGAGYGNASINNGITGGTYNLPPADGLFVVRV